MISRSRRDEGNRSIEEELGRGRHLFHVQVIITQARIEQEFDWKVRFPIQTRQHAARLGRPVGRSPEDMRSVSVSGSVSGTPSAQSLRTTGARLRVPRSARRHPVFAHHPLRLAHQVLRGGGIAMMGGRAGGALPKTAGSDSPPVDPKAHLRAAAGRCEPGE